jgi:hypothetical protein
MEISDLESSLMELDDHDNEYQLFILLHEITFINANHIKPTPEWYQIRADKIYTYADLEWATISYQFYNKDSVMYNTAEHILSILDFLMKELETSEQFNLLAYHTLLQSIHDIWKYYNGKYIGGEEDDDVLDIIRDLTHL